jgi:hypothetical protein
MAVPSSRVDQSEGSLAVAAAGTSKEWQNRETAVSMNDLSKLEVVKFSVKFGVSPNCSTQYSQLMAALYSIFFLELARSIVVYLPSFRLVSTMGQSSLDHGDLFLPHERTHGRKADVFGKS